MTDQPPASIALEKLNIPHQVFRHQTQVNSLEQAASDRNQRPEQVVRSILFQIRPEEFLMVLVAGPAQIDWRKLRQLVKRSRVRMATEQEVLEVTGYRVGTVSPFGLKNPVKVLIDAERPEGRGSLHRFRSSRRGDHHEECRYPARAGGAGNCFLARICLT